MAKITYIRHSCFLLELPEANFIFDYWRDPSDSGSKSRGEIPEFIRRLPEEKPLYLLVSHGHKDHYNPEIFGWAEHFADARFIVSNDVWKRCRHIASPTSVYHGPRVDPERLVRLLPGERFSQGDISISAFPSTDIGNSYMVIAGGKRIFHAGDLNAWIWLEESSEQEIRKAMGDYRACLRHIASPTSVYHGPRVDPERLVRLLPGERFSQGDISISAFPSTDIGNSYMVIAGGKRIFHAGDLNAWIWLEESSEQEIRKAMGDYRACLRSVAESFAGDSGEVPPPEKRCIDFAFFPVDSRLGKDYFTGARIFVREFNVAHFFPMHFGLGDEAEQRQRCDDALKFSLYANPDRGEYIPLASPFATFLDND